MLQISRWDSFNRIRTDKIFWAYMREGPCHSRWEVKCATLLYKHEKCLKYTFYLGLNITVTEDDQWTNQKIGKSQDSSTSKRVGGGSTCRSQSEPRVKILKSGSLITKRVLWTRKKYIPKHCSEPRPYLPRQEAKPNSFD